jgi:RNA polymerase sigma-70 factor (ECF subfamily)
MSERALVLRAQSGDRSAFDDLFRSVDHVLLRYLTRLAGEAIAEDLLQEVLITIVRKIAFLRDPNLFRAWAFRIASRVAFRHLRQRQTSEPVEDLAAETPEPPDPWQRERLLAALPRLSTASRAVVLLHYFEELPLSDVAAALDINVGTAKSRLAYGLAQLRKELKP